MTPTYSQEVNLKPFLELNLLRLVSKDPSLVRVSLSQNLLNTRRISRLAAVKKEPNPAVVVPVSFAAI